MSPLPGVSVIPYMTSNATGLHRYCASSGEAGLHYPCEPLYTAFTYITLLQMNSVELTYGLLR